MSASGADESQADNRRASFNKALIILFFIKVEAARICVALKSRGQSINNFEPISSSGLHTDRKSTNEKGGHTFDSTGTRSMQLVATATAIP
jgi:hypothetical protein